jgi:hypothetical protein
VWTVGTIIFQMHNYLRISFPFRILDCVIMVLSFRVVINDLHLNKLVCFRNTYILTLKNLKTAWKLIEFSLSTMIVNIVAASGAPITVKVEWRLK